MITPYLLTGYLVFGICFLYFIWFITDPEPKSLRGYLALWFAKDSTYTGVLLVAHSLLQLISGIFLPWAYPPTKTFFQITGVLLFTGAVALAVWAKLTMKKNWGTPAQHNLKHQSKLVTWGPFRYTRNPIYLGLALIPFTIGLSLQSMLLPVSLLFWGHLRRLAITEEGLLGSYFGKNYMDYKRYTPRFLI